MNIVIVNKETGKAEHSYYDSSITVKRGYAEEKYAYAEMTFGNDLRGYFWDGENIAYNADLIPTPDPKALLFDAYLFHQSKGNNLSMEVLIDLVIKYKAGDISHDDLLYIEGKLKATDDELIKGRWVSALNEIDKTVVFGAYTSEIKNDIKSKIELHIANNY